MSFYQTRRKPPPEVSGATPVERIVPASPVAALTFTAPAKNWAALRRARPAEALLPASRAWFESLPLEVRPHALVNRYPRIVNLIAQQWTHKEDCRAYFEQLLTDDRRVGRRGFPPVVHRDLRALLEYYQRMHLMADDGLTLAWDGDSG